MLVSGKSKPFLSTMDSDCNFILRANNSPLNFINLTLSISLQPERNDQGTNNNAAEEPPAPPDDIGEDEPRVNGYGEESFSDVSAGELDSPATNRPSDGEPQGCSEGGESGQEGGSKADHDNTLNINTASDRLNNR